MALKKWLFVFLIIVLITSGCASQPEANLAQDFMPTAEILSTPEASQTVAPTVLEEKTEQPEQPAKRTRYLLNVEFDDLQKTLIVNETIHFTNTTNFILDSLELVVDMNRYFNGFELQSINLNGKDVLAQVDLEKIRLSIPLEDPISQGVEVIVDITYKAILPVIPQATDDSKPQVFGYTDRQTNLVDWYPFIPPMDEGGQWLIHEPSYFGEYLVYPLADFELTFTVMNTLRPIIVAASASSIQSKENPSTYTYELEGARNFVLSLSPDYITTTKQVGDVQIISYSFPFDSNAGEAALNNTVDAYLLYTELFGSLQHKTLSVVEADFLDGMEFDGLYFLSRGFYNLYDGTPRGYLTTIAVHETAHQWWYAMVANDQAMDPWLDEALCTYSEILYYEKYYPDLADWWWSYRVDFYNPNGKIDQSVYDYPGFTPYRNAVYLNGARFFRDIGNVIGEQSLEEILRVYLAENSGEIAKKEQLIGLIRAKSPEKTVPIIEEYLSIE